MTKKTLKEKILEELKQGVPLKKLRTQYKSWSSLADAVRIYLSEADEDVTNLQEKLISMNREAIQLNISKGNLETDIQRLEEERRKLASEVNGATKKLKKIKGNVEAKRSQLKELTAQLATLQDKGVTLNLVHKINKIEASTGTELLERVETASSYEKLKKESAKEAEKKKN